MEMRTRIILRNDTTENWNANDAVVLLEGEVGVEFLEDGSIKTKVGDGSTPWSSLAYFDYTKDEVDALIATAKREAIEQTTVRVIEF